MTSGMPTGANENTEKPGKSCSRSRPLLTILVVVNSVAMPPRMVAKASGMSSRDGFTFCRRAAPDTAGSSTAAAAMLFMNSDRKAPATMTSTTSRPSDPPAARPSHLPTFSPAPVRFSPAART